MTVKVLIKCGKIRIWPTFKPIQNAFVTLKWWCVYIHVCVFIMHSTIFANYVRIDYEYVRKSFLNFENINCETINIICMTAVELIWLGIGRKSRHSWISIKQNSWYLYAHPIAEHSLNSRQINWLSSLISWSFARLTIIWAIWRQYIRNTKLNWFNHKF